MKSFFLLFSFSSLESRHLLYLQLRKSILESHILCNDEELISLGGLALQSEIGDFNESVSGELIFASLTQQFSDYMKNFHFIFRWSTQTTSPFPTTYQRVSTKETRQWQSICEILTIPKKACTAESLNTISYVMYRKWKSMGCICSAQFGYV